MNSHRDSGVVVQIDDLEGVLSRMPSETVKRNNSERKTKKRLERVPSF